jgi:hypothetical protein
MGEEEEGSGLYFWLNSDSYCDLLTQAWALAFLTARNDLLLRFTYAMAKTVISGFSIYSEQFMSCICATCANYYGDFEYVIPPPPLRALFFFFRSPLF